MTRPQIMELQEEIGVTPDGFYGPKSIAACKAHLAMLMPMPNPWPASDQASLTKFYGAAGDESRLVNLPTPAPLRYEGKLIKTIRVHVKCAGSLARALKAAFEVAPEIVAIYDGCYNNRPMRGGTLPSLHARGAAIDLDGGRNGNKVSWPIAARMPLAVMKCFAREGWLSAGAFWGRDAMHFQATK